jgi:hypothetical protein
MTSRCINEIDRKHYPHNIEQRRINAAKIGRPGRTMQPLIAYLDESGTHGGSEIMVLSGFLARLDQWTLFEKKFAAVKKRHRFRVFHAVEFRGQKGEFKTWTGEQMKALLDDLRYVISFGLADSVAVTLDNASFKEYYKLEPTRLDSAYGLCFRTCLYYLLTQAIRRKHNGKLPHLHIVLEAGHRNSGDAERIFKEVQREYGKLGILRSLKLAKKDECDPIMIADLAAYFVLQMNRSARLNNAPLPGSDVMLKKFVGLTHLESTPASLAQMREEALKIIHGQRRDKQLQKQQKKEASP